MSRAPVRRAIGCIRNLELSPPSFLCPLLYSPTPASYPRKFFRSSSAYSSDTDLYIPEQPRYPQEKPRWQETPPQMVSPTGLRKLKRAGREREFVVNEDPVKLDDVYERFLGEGGADMLSEEVKWLAVTHKSFDQGRRGFNDRLSFLGKRIIELQVSLAVVSNRVAAPRLIPPDKYERTAFEHPAIQGVDNLSEETKQIVLNPKSLGQLAYSHDFHEVIRWRPKNVYNLWESGMLLVMRQALYAIVGAVALQRGGESANKVARERILSRVGLGESQ